MKLKGKQSQKLKKTKKKKMKKTLKRMEKTRKLDSDRLRKLIVAKLEWAKTERKNKLNKIKEIQRQLHRVEGILLFINDLLQPEK